MLAGIRSEVIKGDVGKGQWISNKYRITSLLTWRQRSLSEHHEYTLVQSRRRFPQATVELRGGQSEEQCSPASPDTLPRHPGHIRDCTKATWPVCTIAAETEEIPV